MAPLYPRGKNPCCEDDCYTPFFLLPHLPSRLSCFGCVEPLLVHGNCSHVSTTTAFYTGGIRRRKRGQCGSYHSANKGQRSGGSETLHGQRCPRPQGREMTGGLFPRQLPGPRLGMQGSGMAGAASDFPGASEHLLPSPPQPPGLSRWSQKLQDLLGVFPAGGSCPPRAPGSQASLGLPSPLSWGPKATPPCFLPQGPSLPSQ